MKLYTESNSFISLKSWYDILDNDAMKPCTETDLKCYGMKLFLLSSYKYFTKSEKIVIWQYLWNYYWDWSDPRPVSGGGWKRCCAHAALSWLHNPVRINEIDVSSNEDGTHSIIALSLSPPPSLKKLDQGSRGKACRNLTHARFVGSCGSICPFYNLGRWAHDMQPQGSNPRE